MSSPVASSLERRLNLGVGLGLALLLLAGSVLLVLTMRMLAFQQVEERVRHDLETLIAASVAGNAVAGDAAAADSAFDRLPLIYQQAYSGHYYRIVLPQRVVRSRSLWDIELEVPPLAPGEQWRGRQSGPQGQSLLVLAHGFSAAGGAGAVAVAEDVAPLEAQIRRVTIAIAIVGLLILLTLLALQRQLMRRGLRPLQQLIDALREVERGERADLPTQGVPAEVLPLVNRFNGLLSLLAARLERSRKGLGNLAHALKTPLAVLTQVSDDLARSSEGRQLGRQLSDQVGQMRKTVDRELKRARVAGGGALATGFQLRPELEALLETLRRIYRERPLAVELDCPDGIRFPGDREDFLELMGVLLDNAFKWARERIRLSIRQSADQLSLLLEDDGPGIPEAERRVLIKRGRRLDESTPGTGLGLSIAQDIVDQYGGELQLETSAFGGLAVRVSLPQQQD